MISLSPLAKLNNLSPRWINAAVTFICGFSAALTLKPNTSFPLASGGVKKNRGWDAGKPKQGGKNGGGDERRRSLKEKPHAGVALSQM